MRAPRQAEGLRRRRWRLVIMRQNVRTGDVADKLQIDDAPGAKAILAQERHLWEEKPMGRLRKGQPVVAVTLIAASMTASTASAQDIDPGADDILRAMSDYLAGPGSFSVTADASTDILMRDGAKGQLTATGQMVLDRATGFHVTRKGPAGQTTIVFDGTPIAIANEALGLHLFIPVAGDDDRADISTTFLQPFIACTTPEAWTFTVNSEASYDWEDEEWAIPINLQVSKMTMIGKQPVSIGGGVRYWAESGPSSPEGWGARLFVSLLFPKG